MSDQNSQEMNPSFYKRYRKYFAFGVAGLALVGLSFFARWFFTCPCEQTPGSVLWGETVEEPVSDWSMANNVPVCQIQVSAPILPHAVNLNCMASASGELFLSCTTCAPKRWSTLVERNSNARVRIGEQVYPVTVTQITDPAVKDRAWRARLTKLVNFPEVPGAGVPMGTPRPLDEQWWTFSVVSR